MTNDQELEPEAEALLRAGKKVTDSMSELPALYSIAISLKRIADVMTHTPNINVSADLDKAIDNELNNWNPGIVRK